MPNTFLRCHNHGAISFTTVDDSAFPRRPWLLKPYDENSCKEVRERYFNRRLSSARVVSEHAYGMPIGRWRFLYKKTEGKLFNIQHVIMACITLHNICIDRSDPCKPRWRLEVNKLDLIRRGADHGNTPNAMEVRGKETNWLWELKEARDREAL